MMENLHMQQNRPNNGLQLTFWRFDLKRHHVFCQQTTPCHSECWPVGWCKRSFCPWKPAKVQTSSTKTHGLQQLGFKSTWLPCLGLDAEQIQPSEPTTEEYPGAEDIASGDTGWAAARSYQKSVISFRKHLSACVNAEGGHFEQV